MPLAVAPDYLDDKEMKSYRQSMKNWSKKLDRLDDEMLLFIRERINYLLEVRSQKYMTEMRRNENKTTN